MSDEIYTPSVESIHTAAQCWCDPETSSIEMDTRLAMAFARRLDEVKADLEAVQIVGDTMKRERDELVAAVLKYVGPHVHRMWGAILVGIVLKCDFKDSEAELAKRRAQ